MRRAHETRGIRRDAISCQDPCFPAALAQTRQAPPKLYVIGGLERLERFLSQPVLAIVGTSKASAYGMETARGLARGLAASGVTVLSALADGIPAAAHLGALEVDGPTITVMPGGADVCYPASRRRLHRRLQEIGCVVSEQPWGRGIQRWSHLACTPILVGMAQMVIVVEAEERTAALTPARLAQALGRTLGAVPGRVSSPVSQGPNALLAEGAHLIRGPQDALDALYGVGVRQAPKKTVALAPPLQDVLKQVGSGSDTLAKLVAAGHDAEQTIVALAELEVRGALVRGDGGRYLPCG